MTMDEKQNEVPDYLRPWFPTEEDYKQRLDLLIDARTAWLHFEPLWTSLGYSICYGTVHECEFRKPLVDQGATGDPFQPNSTGPFVHSLPEKLNESKFRMFLETGWILDSPTVSLAYDKLNRLVVIKAFERKKLKDSSELDILLYLNSPTLRSSSRNHTIPVLEQAEAEGWHFLVMPAWNLDCDPFFMWQVDDYFELITQSLEGLAFMHEQGVAHRDISRRNIRLNQDGTLFVAPFEVKPVISTWNVRLAFIDFGISKRFPLGTDPSTWLVSESWGTPRYMAPEVSTAEEKSLPYQALPADVYALGIVWKRWIGYEYEYMPHSKISESQTLACQVLKKHVPQCILLLEEMLDPNPVNRPTAADAFSRFETMRKSIPEHIRFSPPEGYPKSLA